MIKPLLELDWVINTGKEISFPQSPAKILTVYSGTVLTIPVSFNAIFTSQSTVFQLCLKEPSWVEQVLIKVICVLLKDTTQCDSDRERQVPLEPAAPRSRVKHSTTEPLCSLRSKVYIPWSDFFDFLKNDTGPCAPTHTRTDIVE